MSLISWVWLVLMLLGIAECARQMRIFATIPLPGEPRDITPTSAREDADGKG